MSNSKRQNNNPVNKYRVVKASKNYKRGGKVKPGAIGTPYDDAFRTMLTESDKLTISLLNELFEYNTGNAIQRAELDGNILHVKLPWTGVLYLRDTKSTPDEMIMQISKQDGSRSLSINVPVMKMSDYPLEVVIEKKLWFLFPYCIFTYWRDLESKNSERFAKAEQSIMDMLGKIKKELDDLNKRKLIDSDERNMLETMTVKVVESLAERSETVTKGVEELMGGKILNYEAKEIRLKAEKKERQHLVASIKGLKSGKTPDDLRREGMDEETIQAALECM